MGDQRPRRLVWIGRPRAPLGRRISEPPDVQPSDPRGNTDEPVGAWPPACSPEEQHLPFLSVSVDSELEATVMPGKYRVEGRVTNSGNATSHFAVVELFAQFVPRGLGAAEASAYLRRGRQWVGPVPPHTTKPISMTWADPRSEPGVAAPLQPMRRPDIHLFAPFVELIFIAAVSDPLLDPRPSLATANQPLHHWQVVRCPFNDFDIRGGPEPLLAR
jgi:hypothetical protein